MGHESLLHAYCPDAIQKPEEMLEVYHAEWVNNGESAESQRIIGRLKAAGVNYVTHLIGDRFKRQIIMVPPEYVNATSCEA